LKTYLARGICKTSFVCIVKGNTGCDYKQSTVYATRINVPVQGSLMIIFKCHDIKLRYTHKNQSQSYKKHTNKWINCFAKIKQ